MLDPRDRFSITSDLYSKHRPSYPSALVQWIEQTSSVQPGATVVDVGCGTGITSRLFADRYSVIGVDPSEAMLEKARALGGARYHRGDAVRTGLEDESAQLIIAGQAFHWFELEPTMFELRRILASSGWVVAFWNVRADTPFLHAYAALLSTLAAYKQVPKALETINRISGYPDLCDVTKSTFHHAQSMTEQDFYGRVFSSSYVAHGVTDPTDFRAALRELFLQHSNEGTVSFHYDVHAIAWRFAR
ncbi:MAG: methyltransferase domain-containing protein [Deltaproteobacteria bacterium]|nr:methyltransferase domain-containing protein [Deltaproteobacteria bacterium]